MDGPRIINQSTRRLLTYFGLALLEATPPALLLTLWGARMAWSTVVVVILVAGIAEWITRLFLAERQQRLVLAFIALLLALAVAYVVLPDGDIVAALFDVTSLHNLIGYSALLIGLYSVWRGVRMHAFEGVGLRELFGRSMAITLLALLIGGAGANLSADMLFVTTAEMLVGFAAGLGTVALARAAEPGETTGRAAGWRGATPTMLIIGIVLFLGLALTAMLNGEARQLLVMVSDLLIFLLTALLLPIVMVLAPLLEWLLLHIGAPNLVIALRNFIHELALAQREPPINPFDELLRAMPWLGSAMSLLGRLFPVLMLLALIWYVVRRRQRQLKLADESRESLFSWGDLMEDLQSLLARFRRPEDAGLRAILASLQGIDPDTRVRRSYLRMLIAAEEQERTRLAAQTPREFLPSAQTAVASPEAATRVTLAYERARYSPGSTTSAEAETVEQDWASDRQTA